MTDIAIEAAWVKTVLSDVAYQSLALGTGLLNAAPGDKLNKPNNSVEYLFNISENLGKIAEQCEQFLPTFSSAQDKP